MWSRFFLILTSFFVFRGAYADEAPQAQPTSTVNPSPAAASSSTTNQTNHNFEDLLVQGKYHFSDQAVSTVEADKVFDSLIGVRTDFKDRLEQSANKQ